MIASTLIAISIAAQTPPTQDAKVAPEAATEKKMACCEQMAKGEGCCCCKGMDAKKHGKEEASHSSDHANGHAH